MNLCVKARAARDLNLNLFWGQIVDTTANEPLIPAHVIQNNLKHLNLVADKITIDRILARIPKDILRTVQQAKKTDWLFLRSYAEINEFMVAELGEEGVYNLSFRSF